MVLKYKIQDIYIDGVFTSKAPTTQKNDKKETPTTKARDKKNIKKLSHKAKEDSKTK